MSILNLEKYSKVYSISDIHGNLFALKNACLMAGLLDHNEDLVLTEKDVLVINGDVFDYFYPKEDELQLFSDCSFFKTKSWAIDLLKKFSVTDIFILNIVDYIYGDDNILPSNLNDIEERIGKNKFKLEILGALHVLETFAYLDKQKNKYPSNLFVLIGNHDLDFLNGEWEFRSLQKNFIFSVLLNHLFLEYREYKDKSQNLPTIYNKFQDTSLKELWLKNGSKTFNIFNESYLFAYGKQYIYVHAGLPLEMLDEMLLSNFEINTPNLEKMVTKFSKNKIGANSILTCDIGEDHPEKNKEKYLLVLSKFYKKRIVVGHNPFLGLESPSTVFDLKDKVIKDFTFSIFDLGYIVKLDQGIKFGNSHPKLFLE